MPMLAPDLFVLFTFFDSGNVGDSFDATSGENGVPSFAQLQIVLFGEFSALTVKRYVDQLWDAYQLVFERPISLCYSTTLDMVCEDLRLRYCTFLDRVVGIEWKCWLIFISLVALLGLGTYSACCFLSASALFGSSLALRLFASSSLRSHRALYLACTPGFRLCSADAVVGRTASKLV